ncbi:chorismate mutase [Amycolatopsis sp. CA-230715]|uniref:chorismate mutase n=1 Tax=Amycolatopsis sp. CA-230715 TaxID=2745196 RepID=UPI001C01EF82|nr:chorismate mutase [Amycolatopsis sp. CA-230715]QWF79106.1 Secreted chorismate mutase [Amycolatopsis sp. CA-230715]
MRLRSSILCALVTAVVVAVSPASASASPRESLLPLAGSSAERVQISDKVAAAKYGTGAPIDDPAREQVVLDFAAARSKELGIDPARSVALFRDQIEASKIVQRGLFAYWDAHPDQVPTDRPDLPTEVRPVIDRINGELLAELAATGHVRTSPRCEPRLRLASAVASWQRHLDHLHRTALRVSLSSACDR